MPLRFDRLTACLAFVLLNVLTLTGELVAQGVTPSSRKTFWGDLHSHSGLSFDASCPIDSLYNRARYVMGLDFVCASDHDKGSPSDRWSFAKSKANQYNEPGKFVTLIGYEWTGEPGEIGGGHRLVLFGSDDPPRVAYDSVRKMLSLYELRDSIARWDGLMMIPHSNQAGAEATLSDIDNNVRRGVELVGAKRRRFEFFGDTSGAPFQVAARSFREALGSGLVLGAIGTSDDHTCWPGTGGLTAVIAESLDRFSIFESIRRRHMYATTGARILVEFESDGAMMGDLVDMSQVLGGQYRRFEVRGRATAPIASVLLIMDGNDILLPGPYDGPEFRLGIDLWVASGTHYVYAKIVQSDGNVAWSSPIFFQGWPGEVTSVTSTIEDSLSVSGVISGGRATVAMTIRAHSAGTVGVSVYDILGRQVMTRTLSLMGPGVYRETLPLGRVASGVYFVRYIRDGFPKTVAVRFAW